jgi:protein-tyrosine phosphatase
MRIDFHSHILPGIDDGAANVSESLKLLKLLKDDGVDTVVATPHLYLHRQSADDFIEKREKSVKELFAALEGGDYPSVVVGAEVYFSTQLNEIPLGPLCVAETEYIIIELPYNTFSRTFLNTFADFISCCEYNVILAHIERYYDYNKTETMNEVLSNNILTQVNCDSFANFLRRKKLFELIKSGNAQLLGTDLHSADRRPPMFGKAEKIIRKKLSDSAFEDMMNTAAQVLKNESLNRILV